MKQLFHKRNTALRTHRLTAPSRVGDCQRLRRRQDLRWRRRQDQDYPRMRRRESRRYRRPVSAQA